MLKLHKLNLNIEAERGKKVIMMNNLKKNSKIREIIINKIK